MESERFESTDQYREALRSKLPLHFRSGKIPLDPNGRYTRKKCMVVHCFRVSTASTVDLCRPHRNAFNSIKEPTNLDDWSKRVPEITHTRAIRGFVDLTALNGKIVQDEVAYGLLKRGERDRVSSPEVLAKLARVLSESRIISVLDLRHNRIAIEEILRQCGGYSTARVFLLDTLDELCLLASVEPTRRYLGIASAGRGAFTNLNQFDNEEFRISIERWMTWRLNNEHGAPQYIQAMVGHLFVFCTYLASQEVKSWSTLSRSNLLDYLGHLKTLKQQNGLSYSAKYRRAMIGSVAVFIDEVSINKWASIPGSARIGKDERPRVPAYDPPLMGSIVAARMRTPGNLRLIKDLDLRLAIRIISETGLRRKDVCAGISMDPLVEVDDGKWSMRYLNSKNGEIWWIPVGKALADAISEHMRYKKSRFPTATKLFAVSESDRVLTLTNINRELKVYAQKLDLRNPDGTLQTITPHMFRHQNATDWLGKGMDVHVIGKLLGHKSLRVTELYAKVTEANARAEWEKVRAVNSDGDPVESQSGDIADAAWAHAFLGGATQALPNGRCGMPCSETCEHANACLYCPLFLTTPDYLPVLREQREEHRLMMEMAEREGHQRIVERNQKPFFALNKLIAKLESLDERDAVALTGSLH